MNKLWLLFFSAFIFSCSTSKDTANTTTADVSAMAVKTPKNIIIMMGDGMGVTQITSGLYANNNQLELERLNDIGLHKPYAYDALITDSAAGATAISCGVKTYNGAIGVDHDTIPCKTLLEEAEEKSMFTGLVATSTIVHATPASFIAHNRSRKNYEEIALDFLNTEIEVFIGGGKKYFYNRADERDLYEEMRAKGYYMSDFFMEDLVELDYAALDRFGYLTAEDSPLPAAQGRNYLKPASEIAMNFLSEKGGPGFVLMIEGSQIDWGGHSNNTEYIISEMLDFDGAVGSVLDFAEKDGNTLVVITADHETGGFAIQEESKMNEIVGAFTSDYHTGDLVPVFAYGPGSQHFRGIYENKDIYKKIRAIMGW